MAEPSRPPDGFVVEPAVLVPPVGDSDVPPGRFGVLASQESPYTPDVGVVVLTFHMRGVHAPVGMVSTSPVSVVCLLCLPPVPQLGRHEERYCLPAM